MNRVYVIYSIPKLGLAYHKNFGIRRARLSLLVLRDVKSRSNAYCGPTTDKT